MRRKLLLEYPKDGARELIRAAFGQSSGIKSYTSQEYYMLGKTGFYFGSWRTNVKVSFPETDKTEKTPIVVETTKVVSINITSREKRIHREFLSQLDALRGYSTEQLSQHKKSQTRSSAKEVPIHGIKTRTGIAGPSTLFSSTLVRFVFFVLMVPAIGILAILISLAVNSLIDFILLYL